MTLCQNTIYIFCNLFLLCFFAVPGQCHVTASSKSAIRSNGSKEAFICKTDTTKSLRWIFYAPHSSEDVYVYNGEKLNPIFADRYNVSEVGVNDRQSTLTINDIQTSDAGRYQCLEAGAPKYNHSFELIVLHPVVLPMCYANVEDDAVEVNCMFSYSGNTRPDLVCTPGVDDFVELTPAAVRSFKYKKKIRKGKGDGMLIQCAMNVPNVSEFFNVWSSQLAFRGVTDVVDTGKTIDVTVNLVVVVTPCVFAVCSTITVIAVIWSIRRRRGSFTHHPKVVSRDTCSRMSTRKATRASRRETVEYQTTEHYITNSSLGDISVNTDDYSQISQKSRENDAMETSYVNLNKATREALTLPPSVYVELAIAADNDNERD